MLTNTKHHAYYSHKLVFQIQIGSLDMTVSYEQAIDILDDHGATPNQCSFCCQDIGDDYETECNSCGIAETFHNVCGIKDTYTVSSIKNFLGY